MKVSSCHFTNGQKQFGKVSSFSQGHIDKENDKTRTQSQIYMTPNITFFHPTVLLHLPSQSPNPSDEYYGGRDHLKVFPVLEY